MKNLKFWTILVLFLFINLSFSQNPSNDDQYVHLNIEKSGNDHYIKIISSSQQNDNSAIYFGDIDLNDVNQNEFKFHEGLFMDRNFSIEFTIESNTQKVLSIGFRAEAVSKYYTYFFDNGFFKIQTPIGDFFINTPYNNDDIFKIDKCKGLVAFYRNGILLKYLSIYNSTYDASLHLVSADLTGCFLHFKKESDCVVPYDNNTYLIPKTKVSDDCTFLSSTESVDFYYLQKYAIVKGVNHNNC